MMNAVRMAIMSIRLVMRMKVALFFTFVFPCIFLFVYAGIFSHGNPSAVAFNLGPVLTLNIMGAGLWGLGLQSVMQRERGTLRRYRLAPISSLTVVASNLISNYLLQLPVVALLIFCAMFFFHMPLTINLLTLWFLITVGTFAFAGFGLTLASVANTMQEVQVYNNLVWFALLFLSGVTIPLAVLPNWIQAVAKFLPATYLVTTFQAMTSRSESISAHFPELIVLFLSGFFGIGIAWKLFRWEKDEKIPTSGKWWALALLIPFFLMGTWMTLYDHPEASWSKSYSLMEDAASREGAKQKSTEEYRYDFEAPDAGQHVSRIWHISTISTSTASAAGPNAELSLVSPGANGSEHALRFHGHLVANGGAEDSAQAQSALTLPAAVQNFHGIELWIRGDSAPGQVVSLQFGGISIGPSSEIRLTPPHDWQTVRLPAGRWPAAQTSPPQAQPFNFTLKVSGPTGDFAVDIDEIESY